MRRRIFLGLFAAFPGRSKDLELVPPISGLALRDLRDTFEEARGDKKHEAIDILAPRGTPVRAVVHGSIRKLFQSKPGGITIYLFDERAEYCYYYGHLDGYSEGLAEGMTVVPGQVIGYVGSTGNANPRTPHLHFAMIELGPRKQWWGGTYLNPYEALVQAVQRERTQER